MSEVISIPNTPPAWEFTVKYSAKNFRLLKWQVAQVAEEVARAENHKSLPIFCSQSNLGGFICSYSCNLITPEEQKIADLRREADEREAKLKTGLENGTL